MGVHRLGDALKKARGRMSQKAAAASWDVPLSTLQAIEQGVERHYQPHTLAVFDGPLGTSAWDLYQQSDGVGWDEPAASVADVEELRRHLTQLNDRLNALTESFERQRERSPLEHLVDELDPVERETVVAYAHYVLSQRRSI